MKQNNLHILKEIKNYYVNLLKRNPTDSDINFYYEQLLSGKLHISDIENLLISSDEFTFLKNNQEILNQFLIHDNKMLKLELKNQKSLKIPKAISYVNPKDFAYDNNSPLSERFTEYMWILKNLDISGKLLDVGCTESSFATELSKISSLQVFGIDIRKIKNPNFDFFVEDITKTHFENDFFDKITIISTIEHVGLEGYENKVINLNADLDAIKEIKRILKPTGTLYLTTPFGKNIIKWFRTYTPTSLKKLLEEFNVIKKQFFFQTETGWNETDEKTASSISRAKYSTNPEFPGAIVVVIAQP